MIVCAAQTVKIKSCSWCHACNGTTLFSQMRYISKTVPCLLLTLRPQTQTIRCQIMMATWKCNSFYVIREIVIYVERPVVTVQRFVSAKGISLYLRSFWADFHDFFVGIGLEGHSAQRLYQICNLFCLLVVYFLFILYVYSCIFCLNMNFYLILLHVGW